MLKDLYTFLYLRAKSNRYNDNLRHIEQEADMWLVGAFISLGMSVFICYMFLTKTTLNMSTSGWEGLWSKLLILPYVAIVYVAVKFWTSRNFDFEELNELDIKTNYSDNQRKTWLIMFFLLLLLPCIIGISVGLFIYL